MKVVDLGVPGAARWWCDSPCSIDGGRGGKKEAKEGAAGHWILYEGGREEGGSRVGVERGMRKR